MNAPTFRLIKVPPVGQAIQMGTDNQLRVPDHPIIPFIEGDGTGPDIWRASVRVFNAAVEKAYGGKRRLVWMEVYAGGKSFEKFKTGTPEGDAKAWLPDETVQAFRHFLVGIKGPLTTPVGGGIRSLNVALRQQLDLYVCLRPVRYFPGVPSPVKKPEAVNMVIFRENTEDIYAGVEWPAGSPEVHKLLAFLQKEFPQAYGKIRFPETSGLGIKSVSREGSQRLIAAAIDYAITHHRKSVTLVHKGNIMKYTEGAFRQWGYDLAREEFPDSVVTEDDVQSRHGGRIPEGKIVLKDRIADIMFQMMLLRPDEFDVIATPNLNGDYLSDAVAAEVGGVGIAPGANISDRVAIFEATHGTAPKHAGKNVVNPGSLLFSMVMLLEHIGWTEAAEVIRRAYVRTIAEGIVTYDFARLKPGSKEVSTSAFGDALCDRLERKS